MYNIFLHNAANIIYKDLPFDEKQSKIILFLIVCGILGIILSEYLLAKKRFFENETVMSGFWYGGIILTVSTIGLNWNIMSDDMKLYLMGIIFICIIIYTYQR